MGEVLNWLLKDDCLLCYVLVIINTNTDLIKSQNFTINYDNHDLDPKFFIIINCDLLRIN